jgi:hypothetical protein
MTSVTGSDMTGLTTAFVTVSVTTAGFEAERLFFGLLRGIF